MTDESQKPLMKKPQTDLNATEQTSPDEHLGRSYKLCFISQLTGVSAIGGFLFGYDTSSVAGAQLYFEDTWPDITTGQIASIVSLALIGAAIGSFFSGYVSDQIGRKKVILFADFMFTLGAVTMAVAPSIWVLMMGRIFVGIGVGVAAQIVPLYLSEIAPTEIRGKLIAMNTAMITVGQLISVLLVLALIPSWRAMLGLAAIPSLLQFMGVLCLPESPRWLIKEGRVDEAREVISKLYYPAFKIQKMQELEEEAEKLKVETQLTERQRLHSLFTTYRRCLVIGCGVQAAQQFSGINTAMYYGPSIMIAANITIGNYSDKISALILNIPLSFTNAVGTILSILLIDRLGRRYLMLRSLPVIVFAFFVVAAGMFTLPTTTTDTNSFGGDLAFVGTLLFLLCFGIGMSSTPWAVCSEVFPLHVIGTANSLTTTTNWLSNFVVAWFFPLMLDKDALKGWAFVLLAIFAGLSLLFIYVMLPETANKSIEVILKAILGDGYKGEKSEA